MHYETTDLNEHDRAPVTPRTTRVTVNYLVGDEENLKVFKATKVVHNADGTLSIHTPGSTVTYNNWISFEER